MKKKRLIKLALEDRVNHVVATLRVNSKECLDYVNDDAKPVRVRVPLPEKEQFLGMMQFSAKEELGGRKTIDEQFKFYVACREREIFEQVQEIRKAVKRIDRNIECASLARKFLKEYYQEKTEISIGKV